MTQNETLWCERRVQGEWRSFGMCTAGECGIALKRWAILSQTWTLASRKDKLEPFWRRVSALATDQSRDPGFRLLLMQFERASWGWPRR